MKPSDIRIWAVDAKVNTSIWVSEKYSDKLWHAQWRKVGIHFLQMDGLNMAANEVRLFTYDSGYYLLRLSNCDEIKSFLRNFGFVPVFQ